MKTGYAVPGLLLFFLIVLSGCTESYQNQPVKTPSQVETPVSSKIVFRENFEDYGEGDIPSDRWLLVKIADGSPDDFRVVQVDGNNAMMVQLRGYRQITDLLLLKGLNIGNFSMSFRLHDIGSYDTVPALVFRFTDEGYYLLTYSEYGKEPGTAILYRVSGGTPEKIEEKIIPVRSLHDGEWHDFNLTVDGMKVILKIDGIRVFTTDGLTLSTGMLGFANSDGSLGRYLVDDVIIRGV